MPKFSFFCQLFFAVFSVPLMAQELACNVSINFQQIDGSNRQVFYTLEGALNEFVNTQKWTDKPYEPQERVECNMTFIITSRTDNRFTASLQVSAFRPVYGSNYKTPIFNFKDNAISFQYTEFDPLIFNPNLYESNLVSLISFYAYLVLGIDADTFALKGGDPFYKQALEVVNLAQQGGFDGWNPKRNQLNRFSLVDQILSDAHKEYREVLYAYHRDGFDSFTTDTKKSKEAIREALLKFSVLFKRAQNTFLIRVFFDAKSDEVVSVFKEGPEVAHAGLVSLLEQIYPVNSFRWKEIK